MFLLVHIGLAVVLFTAAASCYSKFIRPPEFDGDQDADNDMRRNNRYDDGDKVPILFDTNILETLLYICQRLPNRRKTLDWLIEGGDGDLTEWKAQYDLAKIATNEEDSIYWFELRDSLVKNRVLASSQYVNVSAPESDKRPMSSPSKTSSIAVETTTSQGPMSSTMDSFSNVPSSEDTKSTLETNPKSGLSRGETAGAAVGATIGGLLILGGLGWLLWARLARKKRDASRPELEAPPIQYQAQQPCTTEGRVELPGDTATSSSHLPKGHPSLYEAP